MRSFILFLLINLTTHFSSAQMVLKVMTYNIRYDTPVDSVNQWPKRTEKVYALIRKYDPDILGIQEAIHHQVMDLVQNLPEYAFVGVGRDDGKTKGEYSAILYKKDRLSIVRQNTFWLSETPKVAGSKNWDAAITRVATWATMKDSKSGKDFFILNTHFDHIGKEARKHSASIIKEKVAALAGGLPSIITGDFNCTPDDQPYETIMAPKIIVLRDPAPVPRVGTSCGFKVGGTKCRTIDYIFHTAEWMASNYTVIQDNDGKYYPSDHLPVITRLELK